METTGGWVRGVGAIAIALAAISGGLADPIGSNSKRPSSSGSSSYSSSTPAKARLGDVPHTVSHDENWKIYALAEGTSPFLSDPSAQTYMNVYMEEYHNPHGGNFYGSLGLGISGLSLLSDDQYKTLFDHDRDKDLMILFKGDKYHEGAEERHIRLNTQPVPLGDSDIRFHVVISSLPQSQQVIDGMQDKASRLASMAGAGTMASGIFGIAGVVRDMVNEGFHLKEPHYYLQVDRGYDLPDKAPDKDRPKDGDLFWPGTYVFIMGDRTLKPDTEFTYEEGVLKENGTVYESPTAAYVVLRFQQVPSKLSPNGQAVSTAKAVTLKTEPQIKKIESLLNEDSQVDATNFLRTVIQTELMWSSLRQSIPTDDWDLTWKDQEALKRSYAHRYFYVMKTALNDINGKASPLPQSARSQVSDALKLAKKRQDWQGCSEILADLRDIQRHYGLSD